MGAPTGNQFWLARASHGRDKIFSTPEMLEQACAEYFQWNIDNPLMSSELVKFQGNAIIKEVPKMRVMSISALSRFLRISESTWRNYREQEDLLEVIQWAESVIRDQMIEGSGAGMLNANIISRLLGLADRREITGKDGAPLTTINATMTPQEAAEAYASAINAE